MKEKLDKGKAICVAYKNGLTLTEISKAFGNAHSVIVSYLERYFPMVYGEPYQSYADKKAPRLEELYNKYREIYVQGLYTRQQLCEILGCNVNELEAMICKYNLNNQWLQTYDGQVTLCNTSKEFRNSIRDFANKYGYKSIRAVAVRAINEFMLQEMLRSNKDEN